MEHILQFAVDIDDQKIVNTVESKGVKQVLNEIKIDILNRIFTKGYYNSKTITIDSNGDVNLSSEAKLTSFAEDIVKDAINDLKPEIINAAADKLAESYKRTKAWKDRAEKAIYDADCGMMKPIGYSHEDLGILGQ